MDNENTIDPWDHSALYNLTPSPPKKDTPQSMMAKAAAKAGTSALLVKPSIIKESEPAKKPESTMAEKYRSAWMVVYYKKEKWRQQEIDRTLKSGKLSDEGWDTDFVKEVIQLAERDDFNG